MKRIVCVVVLLLSFVATSRAVELGNPEKGMELARNVCSQCRIPKRTDCLARSESADVSDIARTPGMTAAALTVTLDTACAGMPMFRLSRKARYY